MISKISQNAESALRYADRYRYVPDAPKDIDTRQKEEEGAASFEAGMSTLPHGKDDTVHISDEARKLAEKDGAEGGGSGAAPAVRAKEDDEKSSGAESIEEIRKQIEEVKQKLQDAEVRLAQGQGRNRKIPGDAGEDPAEAAAKAAVEALDGADGLEEIRAEIKELNERLLTLTDRLREAIKNMGGGSAAVGSAGIGGSGGSGGLGERIKAAS